MKFTLDLGHLDDVETNIVVNFNQAITLPVLVDGKDHGVAIYVGFTSLAALAHGRQINVARVMDVAGRLKLVNEDEQPRRAMNDRELATVLHALRVLQCEGRIEGCAAGDCEHFEGEEALTNEEIDTLCKELNCGGITA